MRKICSAAGYFVAAFLLLVMLVSAAALFWFAPANTIYYPDGGIKVQGEMMFYPDGSPAYQGQWKNGFAWGNGQSFFKTRSWQRETIVEYSGQWQRGLFHGEGRRFNSSGILVYEGQWQEGHYQGLGSSYTPDGVLSYSGEWSQGLRHGPGVEYQGGKIKHDGEWEAGLRHGLGQEFDPDGNLIYQGYWAFGQRQGHGEEYHPHGFLVYSGHWSSGRRNGYGKEYWPDGSLLYSGTWNDGLFLVQDSFYLPHGSPLPPCLGLVYSMAINRGQKPEEALGKLDEAVKFRDLVEQATPDHRRRAEIYSMLEVSSDYFDGSQDVVEERNQRVISALREIASLPGRLTGGLAHAGLRLRFITGLITEEPEFRHLRGQENFRGVPYDQAAGIATYRHRLLLIRLNLQGGRNDVARVALHEFGHAVDFFILDRVSEQKHFDEVRIEEASKVFTDNYFVDFPEEYFAEYFTAWFISNPNTNRYLSRTALERVSPGTAEFFRKEVDQVSIGLGIPGMLVESKIPAGKSQEVVLVPGEGVEMIFVRPYHSGIEELMGNGWDNRLLVEFLARPEFLYEGGQPLAHGDNYLLWLALDAQGNYALGHVETPGMREVPARPAVKELVQVEPMNLADRYRLGLSRMREALLGLLPAN